MRASARYQLRHMKRASVLPVAQTRYALAAALLVLVLGGTLWGVFDEQKPRSAGSFDETEDLDSKSPVESKSLEQSLDYAYSIRLTVLEEDSGEYKDGVCLDGSSPAYHFSPGHGDGLTKWLVFLEGGGWCTSVEDCEMRSNSNLGSSRFMQPSFTFDGILSNSSLRNPYFATWNRVYVRYCDGGSFAGTAGVVKGATRELHFQGQSIFRRVMHHLLEERGMKSATHALLAGCSAGGLASLLHCDQFKEILQSSSSVEPKVDSTSDSISGLQDGSGSSQVVVKCLSDAGFFLDVEDAFGVDTMRKRYASVVRLHKPEMNQQCLDAYQDKKDEDSEEEEAACFFPKHFLETSSTPFFVLNSLYDNWNIDFAFVPAEDDRVGKWAACRKDLARCSKDEMKSLNKYRKKMVKAIKKVSSSAATASDKGDDARSLRATGKQDGAFLLACHIHCQSLWSNTWHGKSTPRIAGKTMAEAAGEWFMETTLETSLIDGLFPSNPSCFNWYSR